ncbi:hypothetical protein RGF97_00870 [Streptomyces roseicoloratus]|uniref:Uncharacterized protein n=1 Tax=Streptomyces roseicoloratus TaxID=2508722 RepID=A0ABY9RNF3_9ACTN|nr:hypothetical protein [Streptomyces roseicoloratus]WMX43716.1 hypothetical protein RGF97_00870 [Streptomyces roseicoloratus]
MERNSHAVNLPADDARVVRLAVRIDNTARDSVPDTGSTAARRA